MKKVIIIGTVLFLAFGIKANANTNEGIDSQQEEKQAKKKDNSKATSTKASYRNEWVEDIYGNRYYYDEYGFKVTGVNRIANIYYNFDSRGLYLGICNGWITEYDVLYYYENGRLVNGWRTLNSHKYFFTNSRASDGVAFINDEMYFFKNYILQTGVVSVSGEFFWDTDKNGVLTDLHEGWAKKDNGEWAYCEFGMAVNGWKAIDGLQYFFENNEMVHDWWLDQSTGAWYFFNGGVMQRSNITINGINCKFDKYGVWKGYSSRWVWENNNYYYKDEWNQNAVGWKAIEGLQYKFNADGTMIRDWYLDTKTETWYFFNGGVMQTKNMIINGKLNIFDQYGIWRGVK